mmetsp:Transcript_18643/g.70513  ORF Transcript_18643/g.70513 Transcript_18643/m.70513 type:complete len:277 (-) Transcript_18643:148-978(-)
MAPLEGRLVDALGVVQSSRRLRHPLGQDFVKGFIFVQCLELLRKSLRQPGEHRPASAHDDVMPDVSPHVRLALCDDLQYQSRQIPALQRPIFRCREVRHLCWQSACAARHVEKDVPCGVRRRLKLCGIGVPTNADACPPGRILGDFLRHLEPLCRQGLPERVAQRASPHGTNGERMLDDLPVIHRDGAGIIAADVEHQASRTARRPKRHCRRRADLDAFEAMELQQSLDDAGSDSARHGNALHHDGDAVFRAIRQTGDHEISQLRPQARHQISRGP